jgi:prefoldin beta subunit
MNKETEDKINHISLVEQSLQSLIAQKQQFQSQLMEVESALKELDQAEHTYKIIGNLMIQKSPKDLKSDTEAKMERLSIRIKNIEKQEEKTKGKLKDLQDSVMSEMKK